MPSRSTKANSQLEALLSSMDTVVSRAFQELRPADRILASHLRGNRQYGGRDRRLISEVVFAVFRWWGWLRRLDGVPLFRAGDQAPEPSRRESARLVFCASLLEACEMAPEVWELLVQRCGVGPRQIGMLLENTAPKARCAMLFRLFGVRGGSVDEPPHRRDLAPDWALEEIELKAPVESLLDVLQKRPPLWLRCRPGAEGKVLDELVAAGGARAYRHPTIPCAVGVPHARVGLYNLEGYRRGLFEVQDLASQMIGVVCGARPRERWWDACAGAGGKALLLAESMGRKGTVVATDIREYKLNDLKKRAKRARLPNIETKAWNGKALRARDANFDGVLVDAPCTCSGTWRRNPDARWTTLPTDLEEMPPLQLRILQAAASGVKPGGTLVYATCSLFRRENEGVVEAFLDANTSFEPAPFRHPATGKTVPGSLPIHPWDGDCDAMFVARFRRKTPDVTES